MSISIERLDLFSDWIEIAKSELVNEGYEVDGITDEEISILYFGLQKKLIKPKPRQIFKSDIFFIFQVYQKLK